MKTERTSTVTKAKIELTTPTPMSFRMLAASPILLGSSFAADSISLVKSYFSFSPLSVSLSLTKSVTSCAYSGTLLARSSACPTMVGMSSTPRMIGIAIKMR